jgi:serine/threonine protein phosphatase PrpC
MRHTWAYNSQTQQRDENEDSFGVFRFGTYTVALICDGMGGQHGGGYASKLAVKVIHDNLAEADISHDPSAALRDAIQSANTSIYDTSRRSHELLGMGTTVTALISDGTKVHVAHVGDSRAYLLQGADAKPITRDHTMVNLFVDAQLLSLEDAQSHPEAHVLSRSLGVERTVEVDVQPTMTISDGDTILITSDGVHSLFADWELASFDYSQAKNGIEELFKQVALRDGVDNATAIALCFGENVDDSDAIPTAPPEPPVTDLQREIHWRASSKGLATHTQATPISAPSYVNSANSAHTAPPVAERTETPLSASGTDAPDENQPPSPSKPAASSDVTGPKGEEKKDETAATVSILAIAGIAVVASILGALLILTPNSETNDEIMTAPSTPIEKPVVAAIDVEARMDAVLVAPELEPASVIANKEADKNRFFAPAFAPIIRDVHRQQKYKNTRSPSGVWQMEAINAAREGNCTRSLLATQLGTKDSPDYAVHYGAVWDCFSQHHRAPIQSASIDTPELFSTLITHFQGEALSPLIKDQPVWAGVAIGGIERRINALLLSDKYDDFFADYIFDKYGEANLAAEIGRDLLLEAAAAAALATVENPTDEVIGWWTRRVYIVEKTLNSSLGKIVREQQPDTAYAVHKKMIQALHGRSPLQIVNAIKEDRELPASLPPSVIAAISLAQKNQAMILPETPALP